MLIKLDYRETDLKIACVQALLQGNYGDTITLKDENLPIGDIIIYDDDGTERTIIERKCLWPNSIRKCIRIFSSNKRNISTRFSL